MITVDQARDVAYLLCGDRDEKRGTESALGYLDELFRHLISGDEPNAAWQKAEAWWMANNTDRDSRPLPWHDMRTEEEAQDDRHSRPPTGYGKKNDQGV